MEWDYLLLQNEVSWISETVARNLFDVFSTLKRTARKSNKTRPWSFLRFGVFESHTRAFGTRIKLFLFRLSPNRCVGVIQSGSTRLPRIAKMKSFRWWQNKGAKLRSLQDWLINVRRTKNLEDETGRPERIHATTSPVICFRKEE